MIDQESIEEHISKLKKQLEEQKQGTLITQGALLMAEALLKEMTADENKPVLKPEGNGKGK